MTTSGLYVNKTLFLAALGKHSQRVFLIFKSLECQHLGSRSRLEEVQPQFILIGVIALVLLGMYAVTTLRVSQML